MAKEIGLTSNRLNASLSCIGKTITTKTSLRVMEVGLN